jgi:Ala-tRNA(Pro) deacylase
MIEAVVRHLRAQSVPFRLLSYPAPEPAPLVANVIRPHPSMLLSVKVLRIDGRPAIAAVADGSQMNLLRLQVEIGASLVEPGSSADLPWPYTQASEPVPPLGVLFGLPLFVDQSLFGAALVGFPVFSRSDFIELAYDDYARIEQPRLASLAGGNALAEVSSEHRDQTPPD